MTAWAQSLIRISNYEVETLQKRLAEITARKADAEMRVAMLEAEAEGERERARQDATVSMMLGAYLDGWKLKKFEHVAETTRLNAIIAAGKRETAAFDEMGLRRRAG